MPKYLPHGTTFRINSALVGGLTSITIPDRTRGAAETTDSGSAFDREFFPGLREGGTIELTFRHIPEDVGQEMLNTNFNANGAAAVVGCELALPDAATTAVGTRRYTFTGFVISAPQGTLGLIDDEVVELTATIKIADATVLITG